ncbi:hypothetical protein MTBBW1_2030022 [Desulfamplus magnetovallimortis]|uniref:GTPase-associated protein 1 N-terminal domain-containing protein n=1 Tax=Desulfamplus magnetovallimortis TaxID=1246637 RepID=A0A1W1HC04_9BACT|nr:hypothetical protein [Desulfamplus magnetovallimortis]SLM29932.1 hypothetical protein MTBBW1_2030022 [Desulfamplus magnetovallimortis]
MIYELIYTSYPRGLKAGTSGFSPVAYTEGMPRKYIALCESLSGYNYFYPVDHGLYALNPVAYSHYRFNIEGRDISVLSRISPAGRDYSGRENKIAHHFVLEQDDIAKIPAGPASVMISGTLFRHEWDDEPSLLAGYMDLKSKMITGIESLRPAWKSWRFFFGNSVGDEMLNRFASSAFNVANMQTPSFIRFNVGNAPMIRFADGRVEHSSLPLIAESMEILGAEKRWEVTFNTYFNTKPMDSGCIWRCCVKESKGCRSLAKYPSASLFDIPEKQNVKDLWENTDPFWKRHDALQTDAYGKEKDAGIKNESGVNRGASVSGIDTPYSSDSFGRPESSASFDRPENAGAFEKSDGVNILDSNAASASDYNISSSSSSFNDPEGISSSNVLSSKQDFQSGNGTEKEIKRGFGAGIPSILMAFIAGVLFVVFVLYLSGALNIGLGDKNQEQPVASDVKSLPENPESANLVEQTDKSEKNGNNSSVDSDNNSSVYSGESSAQNTNQVHSGNMAEENSENSKKNVNISEEKHEESKAVPASLNTYLHFYPSKESFSTINTEPSLKKIECRMMASDGKTFSAYFEEPFISDSKKWKIKHYDTNEPLGDVSKKSAEKIYVDAPKDFSAIYLKTPDGKSSDLMWISPVAVSNMQIADMVVENGWEIKSEKGFMELLPVFLYYLAQNNLEQQLTATLALSIKDDSKKNIELPMSCSVNKQLNADGLPFIIDLGLFHELESVRNEIKDAIYREIAYIEKFVRDAEPFLKKANSDNSRKDPAIEKKDVAGVDSVQNQSADTSDKSGNMAGEQEVGGNVDGGNEKEFELLINITKSLNNKMDSLKKKISSLPLLAVIKDFSEIVELSKKMPEENAEYDKGVNRMLAFFSKPYEQQKFSDFLTLLKNIDSFISTGTPAPSSFDPETLIPFQNVNIGYIHEEVFGSDSHKDISEGEPSGNQSDDRDKDIENGTSDRSSKKTVKPILHWENKYPLSVQHF